MIKDRVTNSVIHVFVLLNKSGVKPDYFIATAKEARARVKQYATI